MLAARLARGGGPSRWEFPGGKVERGETPEGALRREIREELAMDIEVGEAVHETDVPDVGQPMRLRLFRARWRGGGPELCEHDEVGWFSLSELERLDWHRADVELLRVFLEKAAPTPSSPG